MPHDVFGQRQVSHAIAPLPCAFHARGVHLRERAVAHGGRGGSAPRGRSAAACAGLAGSGSGQRHVRHLVVVHGRTAGKDGAAGLELGGFLRQRDFAGAFVPRGAPQRAGASGIAQGAALRLPVHLPAEHASGLHQHFHHGRLSRHAVRRPVARLAGNAGLRRQPLYQGLGIHHEERHVRRRIQ